LQVLVQLQLISDKKTQYKCQQEASNHDSTESNEKTPPPSKSMHSVCSSC